MFDLKPQFRLTVLSPNELIYEKEVHSVFLKGDEGEFEILAYHYPLISVLKEGDIVIDWNERLFIKSGVARFFANECTILIEEQIVKTKT
jgi:F-type H+-transporting ATPase subunit epsilon